MDLQILISKKGTRVVKASSLYLALELTNKQYSTNLRRWLNDVYQFQDGIRKPIKMKDYAPRQKRGHGTFDELIKDYYLSVELAKLIALASKSKIKKEVATFLYNSNIKPPEETTLNIEQVMAVLELSKVMGLVSCQTAAEKKHLEKYGRQNKGDTSNWMKFRYNAFGYSSKTLREKMEEVGKNAKGKTQRQMLMQLDKYEMVKTGVVDLFMALGKTQQYAKSLGELAKVFAQELNVDIYDDRGSTLPLMPQLNKELAKEVKQLKKGRYLQLWEQQRMAS